MRNKERIDFSTEVNATMKYDREFQPPRQCGYDVSTNETWGKKVRQTFVEYFENRQTTI